ncbi:hypothetical protein QNI22_22700 [Cytophagaceae bacterium BD1B2-1]|uniref:Uncharacterized protein n=1 Tax=Xanthocytophaga agilis TaxID=3048010 RepID=A0AAE3R5B4_9BACT|nr:hypothetical protein [Xanthocytophaga agilis]
MKAKAISRIERLDILPANAYKIIQVCKPTSDYQVKLPLYQSSLHSRISFTR